MISLHLYKINEHILSANRNFSREILIKFPRNCFSVIQHIESRGFFKNYRKNNDQMNYSQKQNNWNESTILVLIQIKQSWPRSNVNLTPIISPPIELIGKHFSILMTTDENRPAYSSRLPHSVFRSTNRRDEQKKITEMCYIR